MSFAVLVITGLLIDDVTGAIDDTNAKSDVAPAGGSGFWRYDVKVAPARIVFRSLTMAPKTPKAGKTFTVRMAATRSDTDAAIVNGQVDCTAKAGARNVQARHRNASWAARRHASSSPGRDHGQDAARHDHDHLRGQAAVRPFSAKIG